MSEINENLNLEVTDPVTPNLDLEAEEAQDVPAIILNLDMQDGASVKSAEAWAVGQRGGVDVPSTDVTYHNNSKYYAEETAAAIDDIVVVQDATPTAQKTKVWMPATAPSGVQVPTYAEHQAVEATLAKVTPTNTGTQGQILRNNGHGGAVWTDAATEEEVATAAEAWLADHVSQGETLAIDNTLTLSGYAGDAKVTGDKISELKSATYQESLVKLSSTIIRGKYIASTGVITDANPDQSAQWEVTDYVDVTSFSQVAITAGTYSYRLYYAFYDENKNYIPNSGRGYSSGVVLQDEIVSVPSGATYCVAMWYYSTSTNDPIIKGVIGHVQTNYVTPEYFGAIGDGTTDDTQSFVDMLASGENNIVCTSGKNYYITGTLTFGGKRVNLNGCTVKSSASLILNDNNEVYNGTILQYGVTSWSIPAISVEGENNNIHNVNFEGYTEGVFYVFTRKDSVNTLIENCHFDGKPKMSIHVGGSKCTIRQCVFDDSDDSSSEFYSNCIKLDADNSADSVTPCSRDTIIEQCTFGTVGDNCIDCFSGARGLIIRQCTFNNGAHVGIEIKNKAINPSVDDTSEGYSIAGLRECRDITIEDCIFTGTEHIFVASSTKTANVNNYIPIRGLTVRNCIGLNINKDPFGISATGINNVVLDNLQFPAFTESRYLNLYGDHVTLKNCNIYFGVPNCYGDNLVIQDCTLRRIQPVGANTKVDIIRCKCSNTAGGFIYLDGGVNAGIVRVFECEGRNIEWLIQSRGKARLLLAKNNVVVTLFNNTEDVGSKGYFFENFYSGHLSTNGNTGIIDAVNNYELSV